MKYTGKDENVFVTGIRATYTPVDCGGGQGPLPLPGTGTTVQIYSVSENRPSLFSVKPQEQPQTARPASGSAIDTLSLPALSFWSHLLEFVNFKSKRQTPNKPDLRTNQRAELGEA